ncbi:MAG: hypothetical protein DELT_00230 [Desulfovibrio sp.]
MTPKDVPPHPTCASCPIVKRADRRCIRPDGKAPPNCPTAAKPEVIEQSLATYTSGKFAAFAQAACQVERAGYGPAPGGGLTACRPRIVETVDFARRMGYKKLGLVFCMGLRSEAKITAEILETNGFAVVSAICKVGCTPKTAIGARPEDLLNPANPESICNPVMQAMLMNAATVEFNILLGLCVGHDSLALAHLDAPATVLAVKDRLMAHNPVAPLYMYNGYCQYLHNPLFPS